MNSARWEFSVTLTRGGGGEDGDGEGEKENAPPLPHPPKSRSSSSSYAKLFVGTPENDALLLCETVSLGTFRSPYTVRLAAPAGVAGGGSRALSADAARPPAIVAAVLHDRVVGLDVVASPHSASADFIAHAHAAASSKKQPAAAPKSARPAPPSFSEPPPAKKAAAATAAAAAVAAAGRQANLFEAFKVVPAAVEKQLEEKDEKTEKKTKPACVPRKPKSKR